jgi:hypothetical protein
MEPPVKNKRPSWYYSTIHRLAKYKQNCDRIAYLQKELGMMGPKTTPGYSDQPHGSGTTDSTGDLATRVGDKHTELLQLQKDVELIDYAVSMLSAPKQLIIKVRYLTEGGMDKGAAVTLRNHAKRYQWRAMHHSTYERLRDEAVREIAGILGEVKNNE